MSPLPTGALHDWQWLDPTTIVDQIGSRDLSGTGLTADPFGMTFAPASSSIAENLVDDAFIELDATTDFTFAILIKPGETSSSAHYLVRFRSHDTQNRFGIQIRNESELSAYVDYSNGATHGDGISVDYSAWKNTPFLLTVRWDSANEIIHMSINDAPITEVTYNAYETGSNGLRIGSSNSASFPGVVARTVTWDRFLSDSEVHTDLFQVMGAFAYDRGELLQGYSPEPLATIPIEGTVADDMPLNYLRYRIYDDAEALWGEWKPITIPTPPDTFFATSENLEEGTYQVQVEMQDSDGVTQTITRNITVLGPSS